MCYMYMYIHNYMQVKQELFVDTSRGEKLQINIDVVFHSAPCLCKLHHMTVT